MFKMTYERWLVLLIFIHILGNVVFLNLNKAPVLWDPANHTRISIELYNCFVNTPGIECLRVSNYYPIFVHTVAAILILFVGKSVILLQFLGSIFFAVCLYAVYLLLITLLEDKKAAFWSTVVFSSLPVIYFNSRFLWVDIPLLTLCLLSMVFLLKSKNFSENVPTLLAFIFAGLAMMTKWYAPIYLIFPFAYCIYGAFEHKFNSLIKTVNFATGAVVALGIIFPWYFMNYKSILSLTSYFAVADISQPASIFSLTSLTWYLITAYKYQLGPILFILAILGGAYFLKKGQDKKAIKIYIVGEILVSYVLLTLIGNKDIRFSFILLPFLSVFIYKFIVEALNIFKNFSMTIKAFLIAILVLLQVLSYFVFTTGYPFKNDVSIGSVFNFTNYPVEKPNTNKYPLTEITGDLIQISTYKPTRVGVAFDYPHFNGTNLALQNLVQNGKPSNLKLISFEPGNNFDPAKYASNLDYVLISNYESSIGFYRYKKEMDSLQNYLLGSGFKVEKSYNFPFEDVQRYILSYPTNISTSNRINACQTGVCNQIILVKTSL